MSILPAFPPLLLVFALFGSLAERVCAGEVLVYGATPAGIAAAIAAAESGEHVTLVEPRKRIGGMMTNGLSHTDFRTFEGIQNDFAARMDRCVRPFNEVNHAPRAVVNGDASLALISADAKAGEVLKFHAEASTDPDGDALSHHWWHYPEPGSYRGDVVIDGAATPHPSIRVPPDAARKNFHLILEITDDGSPPLRAYRRVLVTVKPNLGIEM